MRLFIRHHTQYRYAQPVSYALQQLRLTPKDRASQHVESWDVTVTGGTKQAAFQDEHANHVDLVSMDAGHSELTITATGVVKTLGSDGVVGPHQGFLPLWHFLTPTDLTRPGRGVRALVKAVREAEADGDIALLHTLSAAALDAAPYAIGTTAAHTSAEQALTLASGVCQDHAHIFCAAARLLGYPARYVSGYLLMDGVTEQAAAHAWAEAYVEHLGWVGFDVANAVCPDDRYVRVATGRDYREAAPVIGMHFGGNDEDMLVSLQVQQQ